MDDEHRSYRPRGCSSSRRTLNPKVEGSNPPRPDPPERRAQLDRLSRSATACRALRPHELRDHALRLPLARLRDAREAPPPRIRALARLAQPPRGFTLA